MALNCQGLVDLLKRACDRREEDRNVVTARVRDWELTDDFELYPGGYRLVLEEESHE